ncbi:MAG: hypothetical protein AB4372_15725 [Xenococcus sp. (in: cyanobacteria)]
MSSVFVLRTWEELKKRHYEEINLKSRSTAFLAALIENIAGSFGEDCPDFNPKKFLPIQFPEESGKQLPTTIDDETLGILKELNEAEQIPSEIIMVFHQIDGLYEFLKSDHK